MSVTYNCLPVQAPESFINAARAMHINWNSALAEIIDNSCDFGASRVTVTFSTGSVEIEDDGEGCADPSFILSPGKHGMPRNGRPRIGRYGHGGTEAMMNLADEVFIRSRHEGIRREVRVVYKDFVRRNSWEIEGEDPCPDEGPSGLLIRLKHLRLSKPDYQSILAYLGNTYGPGIQQGEIQILLNTSKKSFHVKASQLPQMGSRRDASSSLGRCRDVDMQAGIIGLATQHSRQGVSLAYGYRVIKDRLRTGLGDRPTPGLFVFCHLRGSGWSLGRHKADISQKDLNDLGAAIRCEFGDIIAAAEKRGDDIELSQVNTVLAGIGNTAREILRRNKQRRNPPSEIEDPDSHKGKGLRAYAPHLRERKVQPGGRDLLTKGGQTGFQLSREELTPAEPLLSMQGDSIVLLNTAHPAYRDYNSEVGDWWGLAATLFFANHAKEKEGVLIKEIRADRYDGIASVFLESYFQRRFSTAPAVDIG